MLNRSMSYMRFKFQFLFGNKNKVSITAGFFLNNFSLFIK